MVCRCASIVTTYVLLCYLVDVQGVIVRIETEVAVAIGVSPPLSTTEIVVAREGGSRNTSFRTVAVTTMNVFPVKLNIV